MEGVTLAGDTGLLLMQWNYRKFLTLSRLRLFSSKQYSSAHIASVEAYGSEAHAHMSWWIEPFCAIGVKSFELVLMCHNVSLRKQPSVSSLVWYGEVGRCRVKSVGAEGSDLVSGKASS